jgi:hypothetical protein
VFIALWLLGVLAFKLFVIAAVIPFGADISGAEVAGFAVLPLTATDARLGVSRVEPLEFAKVVVVLLPLRPRLPEAWGFVAGPTPPC